MELVLYPEVSTKFKEQLKELKISESSTYIKNAKDFKILLVNQEFGALMHGFYVYRCGFDFINFLYLLVIYRLYKYR